MNHSTRLRIAHVVGFLKPKPQKIPLSIEQVLGRSDSLDVVERFNKLYYDGGLSGTLNWRGQPMIKNPCDLWMMLELLQTIRPAALIETGTHHGASAVHSGLLDRSRCH